jgi:hypothetical protein
MAEERHIIAVQMDERALGVLFRDGTVVRAVNGIPRDAKLLGVHTDFVRRCFVAMFEHPSFPVCMFGAEPERRYVGFEVLEHPMANTYDMIPLRIGMGEREYLDMRKWIYERAAEIEGREYRSS